VLCLHGLAGTPWDVRLPAEHLAGLGFRCVGPLLPGHGTSPAELARTSADAWLSAALGAYDALAERHSRVYVFGLSMGGVLALALCQQRAVSGAVLLAVPLQIRARLRLAVQLLHRFVAGVPRVPGIIDPVARAANPGYRRMPLPAVRSLIALQARVCADLTKVRQPLLLVYSSRDRTVELANAERIRQSVASEQVELLRLERSGHVLTVDSEHEGIARSAGRFLLDLASAGV
jgi:carboxylesterase